MQRRRQSSRPVSPFCISSVLYTPLLYTPQIPYMQAPKFDTFLSASLPACLCTLCSFLKVPHHGHSYADACQAGGLSCTCKSISACPPQLWQGLQLRGIAAVVKPVALRTGIRVLRAVSGSGKRHQQQAHQYIPPICTLSTCSHICCGVTLLGQDATSHRQPRCQGPTEGSAP